MSPVAPRAIIVVDDVCRLGLYVWRYFSRTIGFGIGSVLRDHKGSSLHREEALTYFRDASGRAKGLLTPTREYEVWWVNAMGRWWEELSGVADRTRSRKRWFLLDVRGPYTRRSAGAAGEHGGVAEALAELVAQGVRVDNDLERSEVLLISSYHSAPYAASVENGLRRYLRIYPKSPATLQLLWERDHPTSTLQPAAPRTSHTDILVTGAGFEARGDAVLELGTRDTATALSEVFEEIRFKTVQRGPKGYPLPQRYAKSLELERASISPDLDAYWDALLTLELAKAMKLRRSQHRPDKVKASEKEYGLRGAFRRQLLNDDWGFLNQALDALEMPGLIGWLTTNYTRFADRAIDLWAATNRPAQAWRIIATANEASRLLEEQLQRSGGPYTNRFLFKLHGDIAHLLTMALAGHDKELFSPLSLPIKSLHPLYTAAESFLKQSLSQRPDAEAASVIWHIVGHGLKDRLLMRLIQGVYQATSPRRKHHFLVVDKIAPADGLLREALGRRAVAYPIKASARDYMAQVGSLTAEMSASSSPSDLGKTIKAWIKDRFPETGAAGTEISDRSSEQKAPAASGGVR